MDSTEFGGDDQATLALNLVTDHGRAIPLLWLSMWKEELKCRRNDIEDTCLRRLCEVLPRDCHVTNLADRGFGDHKLFAYLTELGFAYVIRFRGNIHVTDATGQTRTAAEWVEKSGRARKLVGARVTASHAYQMGAVVCAYAPDMKEAWCLAASDTEAPAATLIKQYGRRWTIEPSFRDTKDLRFGVGMSQMRINEPERRDGPAAQTQHVKDTHALVVPPGLHVLYELIPNMPEHRLAPLMQRFADMLASSSLFRRFMAVTE